jgi:hypothetical protein
MALPENPDMKQLPDCVADMPKLTFINLQDSGPDNGKGKLPQRLQETATERQMAGLWYVG